MHHVSLTRRTLVSPVGSAHVVTRPLPDGRWETEIVADGPLGGATTRWGTCAEAVQGHGHAVRMVKGALAGGAV